jgi:transcriptional regulator with XRE-family HTH domain
MSGKRNTLAHDREIGRRIKILRLQKDVSQTFLGDALGVTFQQVQKYEKGTNRVSASRLQQIAKILNVSITFFFDDDVNVRKNTGSEVFALLDTAYSLRLMKAFARIRDRELQRSTVELVEELAEATGSRHS